MTDLDGSASTPGVETNVMLGKRLGWWPIRADAVVYGGIGHMALSMHIADAEHEEYELSWAHDMAWSQLRCVIKKDGEIVATVELPGRNLLKQLADVGFTAMEFGEVAEMPEGVPTTVDQHLLKLHTILGTVGKQADVDPYEAVAESQRKLELFLHAESATSYLNSKQQALLTMLVAVGRVEYQWARNPDDVPGHEKHSYVVVRPSGRSECLASTPELVGHIASLANEVAWELQEEARNA